MLLFENRIFKEIWFLGEYEHQVTVHTTAENFQKSTSPLVTAHKNISVTVRAATVFNLLFLYLYYTDKEDINLRSEKPH
jgi:hypothetical protein